MGDAMTMTLHWLTDRLAVSGALGPDDLNGLRARGIRTVIDLRSDGEPRPQGVAPWEEATALRGEAIHYRQIAVEPQLLSDALAHAVLRAVDDGPVPVLLHCTSGRRAGTFGLLALARDEGLAFDDCRRRGREVGLDFDDMPRLTAFLERWIQTHGTRRRAGAGAPATR
jgi:uncharacterized protein (TIGR01244 family)